MQHTERYEICKLELKYCELCGGLWIRPKGSARTHCGGCRQLVAKLAPPCGMREAAATCRAKTRRRS